MRTSVTTALGILAVILSVSGIAQAQSWIQVQGTIQAVDCQTNILVLNARDGTHAFPMAGNASVFINSTPAGFCTLGQYIGSYATVSVTAMGSQLVAGRVDVSVAAAPPPPPPAYYPYYSYYPYPYYGPFIGIGILFVPPVPSQTIVLAPVPSKQIVVVRVPHRQVVFVPRFPHRRIMFFVPFPHGR